MFEGDVKDDVVATSGRFDRTNCDSSKDKRVD